MKAYKFIIPAGKPRELPGQENRLGTLSVDGCFAVVVAENEERARARLVEDMQLNGLPNRWIEVADVHVLDLVDGAVLIRGMM